MHPTHLDPASLFFNAFTGSKRDYDQRITSIVHSILVTGLVVYQYYHTDLFTESFGSIMLLKTSSLAPITMAISLGYFIFDTSESENLSFLSKTEFLSQASPPISRSSRFFVSVINH